MRYGSAVLLVGFRLQNLFDLVYRKLQLFVPGVEVRRYAYACARTVIDQEVSSEQLLSDLLPVRHGDDVGVNVLRRHGDVRGIVHK